ncbi:RNA-directed DNA polymerase, eukaryota [Tanacetum coccineum]
MRELNMDYGATPFRVFHSWFNMDGFDRLVELSWNNLNIYETNEAADVDIVLDQGGFDKANLKYRSKLLKDLQEVNSIEALDIAQKDKACWSIEGDENSKYFHGSFHRGCNASFITLIPKIQYAKVVKDFHPISLIGSVYKIIAKELANRLHLVMSDLVSDVQYAFVANRQILDGPFILNELMSWCEWDASNINTIVKVLKCFFMASGLKINIQKSKLMGLGVHLDEVDSTARLIGCSTLSTPFIYLGVKVGDTLSIGGRLTLLKSVLSSIPLYHMSIFKVPMGINLFAPIRKKVENGEDTLFWEETWLGEKELKLKYPRLYSLESCKQISVAEKMNHASLSSSFRRSPRGGDEDEQFWHLQFFLADLILPQMNDRWYWSLNGSGEFSVKSARILIDDTLLSMEDAPTRWVKLVPIKINIFAWRLFLDKLPTRLNISLRGVEISSILFPICNASVESSSHLLFSCPFAHQVRSKVFRWWGLDDHDFSSYDAWLLWLKSIRMSSSLKVVFEGVCYVMWWAIWRFRNRLLFDKSPPRKDFFFDDIVLRSSIWCSSRCSSSFNWVTWMQNPNLICL